MQHEQIASGQRKSVNLSLDTGIVAAAKEAGLNLSRVSEAALRIATREAQDAAWKRENAEWVADNNRWVEENGLPLEKYRLF